VPACEETRYQFSTKESKLINDKINNGLSNNSINENFSFKLAKSGYRIVSYYSSSVGNIFTSFEAVLSAQTDMSLLLKKHADHDLFSSNIPISDTNIAIHTKVAEAKKATELESSQDDSIVSELSDSNVSSIGRHGLFKPMPCKILTFEDLIAAHEVQKLEEETNSDIRSGIKDLRENKAMSAKEGSIINDTRKTVHSESKQNTLLDSEEEISEVIEEEIEAESIGAVTESSNTIISDSSFRTNSSYGEMMNQLSIHSANKHVEKQVLSTEQNVSSEQSSISSRCLSLQPVSFKSEEEEASDNDITHSSSVKSEPKDKILSTVCGSGDPSSVQPSSPSDSQESRSLRSNSNKTDMKPLENTDYCSIGVQTESDMVCHPVLHAKSAIQHSCSSQPVIHSDTGESHKLQESVPVYRYYSRTVDFPG
jgi:hypothetical protein